MVGPTLVEIRDHVEALASDAGDYHVVCGRTGDRPVPVSGLRFEGRETAGRAARATEQYRSALRRYDPQVPYYDLIVCQGVSRQTASTPTRSRDATIDTLQRFFFSPASDTDEPDRRALVEFCHRIAGAVLETLSEEGYDDVGSAVMDAYLELAETIGDPNELCLCLLESVATELDEHLGPNSQSEILAGAATRLEPVIGTGDAITGTLSTLAAHGLIESYTRSPRSVCLDGGTRSVAVRIDGYVLSSYDGRLSVLPLTVELVRHQPPRLPRSIEVAAVDGGLQFTFSMADTADRNGLVSARIDGRA